VRILINGGAGSRPKPASGEGVSGILKGWRCRSEYVEV